MPISPDELANKTAVEIIAALKEEGLSASDANVLVADWVATVGGRGKRRFRYQTGFPEVDPACHASFVRSFEHQDWIDGESVVQAEATTAEEGFNSRLHKIETDLDNAGADVARAFVCIADMRRDLFNLLEEVRTEINRLNSDVFDCCDKGGGGGGFVRPGSGLVTDTGTVLDPTIGGTPSGGGGASPGGGGVGPGPGGGAVGPAPGGGVVLPIP